MQPVCVIVGAGPGMGLAVARRFGREGFQLALLARSARTLEQAAAELAQTERVAQQYVADAGDLDGLVGALEQVAAKQGAPAVLVYNAVSFTAGPISGKREHDCDGANNAGRLARPSRYAGRWGAATGLMVPR